MPKDCRPLPPVLFRLCPCESHFDQPRPLRKGKRAEQRAVGGSAAKEKVVDVKVAEEITVSGKEAKER